MLLQDAKREVNDRVIVRTNVYRVPIKNNPANGYAYKIVFYNETGDGDFLTRQRGGARYFSTLHGVEKALLKIGVRYYSVIMLEYEIGPFVGEKFTKDGYIPIFLSE